MCSGDADWAKPREKNGCHKSANAKQRRRAQIEKSGRDGTKTASPEHDRGPPVKSRATVVIFQIDEGHTLSKQPECVGANFF
jgi:hypothetical protein